MKQLIDVVIILEILFFFSAVICIFFGSYSLYVNPKSKLNILFFATSLSLGVWSLGFGLFMHGDDTASAFIWRRVASIGCSLFYSFLLHFLLTLTKKDKFLKNTFFMIFMYFPALISIYIFGISSDNQYIVVKTIYGFNSSPVHNLWEKFFLIYYISYTVIGLINILYWALKTNNTSQKKVAYLIFWSFTATFVLGNITYVFSNIIFSAEMPQIVPILVFLPIGIIFHAMFRYGFMLSDKIQRHEDILNDSTRAQVYSYFSGTFIIGSIFSLIIQTLYYENIYQPIFSSVIILLLGVFVRIIGKLNINNSFKDILLIVAAFVAIPVITLIFLPFGSMTIWGISIIFIIISLVFTKRMVLAALSVSILTTQIIVWLLSPKEVVVSIDNVVFFGRICILSLAIWLAFYVNRVYIKRLEENKYQAKMQTLISDISTEFISVTQSNLYEKIYSLACKVGDFFNIDRCYVFAIDIETNTMSCVSKWCNSKILPKVSNMQVISMDRYYWLLENFKNNHIVKAEKLSDLPEEAELLKEDLKYIGVKSILLAPISGSNKLLGFIGIDSIRLSNEWSDEQIANIGIINNILSDAFTRVEAEKEINYMAYHDYLTGLPNRRLFNDRLNQAIYLAKRTEKIIGLIFIDLDSFKVINDTIGHEGGDQLLKIVSEKLVNIVRQSDTVSRFGGDEFIIMLNNLTDDVDIRKISEKVMSVFKQPFNINRQEFYVTTSVGIAMYPFDGTDAEELIKNADIAMYKAKEKGRNQVFICSHELKEEIIKKIKITNSLHRALERNEFYLNYQPQIELITGRIIGLEALIRWRHPEMGIIPPSVFIPIAEQAGLINRIGEWVLKTAYEQNRRWQINGYEHVRMAVNVSANQLRSHNLIEQIKEVMEVSELTPEYMELEITESAAMNETDYIVRLLGDIKSLGILISIDDFGTDYSSLSRLKVLPIDKLKIDKQFIDGIEESEKDKAIVRTIINLAKNLNIKVIAEGVETENQINFLKEELCDEIQGYYYYKPMSAINIENILKKGS